MKVIFARLGILLALLFVTLPLVVRTVQPIMQELDPAEEEASRVLGGGPWITFRASCCRTSCRGSPAGSLLALARALGEFGAVVIVSGQHHQPDADGAGPHHPADHRVQAERRPRRSRRSSSACRSCWC